MAHGTFQVGNLTAVIGDNEAHDQHAAGYNGIHQLIHRDEPTSLSCPPLLASTWSTSLTVTKEIAPAAHAHVQVGKLDPVQAGGSSLPGFHVSLSGYSARLPARLHRAFLGELHQRSRRQEHLFPGRWALATTLHTGA
jgi:hypothetical protein